MNNKLQNIGFVEVSKGKSVTGEAQKRTICQVPGKLNYQWVDLIKPPSKVPLGLLQRDV